MTETTTCAVGDLTVRTIVDPRDGWRSVELEANGQVVELDTAALPQVADELLRAYARSVRMETTHTA